MALVAPGTVVLIVDDDLLVRESVADTLACEGYETRAVPSADAAWTDLNRGARPSLIVLDLWIAGMSSGEFIRRLRASAHAGIPVLLLSGERWIERSDLDVEAAIPKSAERTTLVRAVDSLVGPPAGAPPPLVAPRAQRPRTASARARRPPR